MAGICSRHRSEIPVPGCKQCAAHPRDIFPDWDEKVKQAEASGIHVCECGFKYYKTIDFCPLCGKKMSMNKTGP